ncbi:MAG: hypothetical protein CM15mP128_4050 [Methanobacteriota archaeon]|nr:MAG: hypothetical protein CM15mP128_4050 [Euryarchaeota archaeon]
MHKDAWFQAADRHHVGQEAVGSDVERHAEKTSALRWYIWQFKRPSATWNWKKAWHGISAMSERSATFRALTMILRLFGSSLMRRMASAT